MNVAKTMKELVEGKGITYTFISSKTGISVDAISKSFHGKRRLTADELVAICKYTNIDLNDIMANEKNSAA